MEAKVDEDCDDPRSVNATVTGVTETRRQTVRRIVHIVRIDGRVVIALPVDLVLPVMTVEKNQGHEGNREEEQSVHEGCRPIETELTLAEAPR